MAKQQNRPLTEAEQRDKWKKRGDAFWNIFLPTKDGRIKSTMIVNSFCLSILFLAVYICAYLLMLDGLDGLMAGKLPVWLINIIESVLPALTGSMLCCVLHFVFKEKKLVPAAYTWLFLYMIGAVIYILAGLPKEDRVFAFQLMLMIVPASLITGCGLSAYLYLRHQKLTPPPGPPEERKPWQPR